MKRKGCLVTGVWLLNVESDIYHAHHTAGNRYYLCDCGRELKVRKNVGYRGIVHTHKRNEELF